MAINRSLTLPPFLGNCILTKTLILHPCLSYAFGMPMFMSINRDNNPKALQTLAKEKPGLQNCAKWAVERQHGKALYPQPAGSSTPSEPGSHALLSTVHFFHLTWRFPSSSSHLTETCQLFFKCLLPGRVHSPQPGTLAEKNINQREN